MKLIPRGVTNFMHKMTGNVFQSNPVVMSLFPSWRQGSAVGSSKDMAGWVDEGYRRNAIVHACIKAKADSVSEPELVVYELDSKGERAMHGEKHPLVQLLDHPNDEQTQYELLREMIVHLEAFGCFMLHKVRGRSFGKTPGRVVQLFLLNPSRTKPVPGKDGSIEFFRYTVEGQYKDIPAADVIYQKYADPLDDYLPLGPIMVLARQGDLDNKAVDYLNAFFSNAGVPYGMLKFKMRVPKTERERIKVQYKEDHQGPGGWHTIDVLDADCEYQSIGTDPAKLELSAIFGHTESRISSVFGVPLIIIGSYLGLMRSTLSNIGAAQKVMWQNTLVPLYTWTADKLTEGLAKEFGEGIYIDFDLTDVEALQETKKDLRDFAIRAWDTGLVTRNKALEMVGEVPVGTDGEVYKTSTSTVYTAVGEVGAPATILAEAAARRLVGRKLENVYLLPAATEALALQDPPMTRLADEQTPRLRRRFFASSGRCGTAYRRDS